MAQKRDEIRELCSARAAAFGSLKQPGLGLELLALELVAIDPDFYEVVKDVNADLQSAVRGFHSGGPSDGGIDGLLYDAEATKVAIIQCKDTSRSLSAATKEEARSFFSRADEWCDASIVDELNEDAQRLLEEAGFDPSSQEVQLIFVTTQTATDDDYTDLAEMHSASYQDRGMNVTCSFWTQAELTEQISNSKAVLAEEQMPIVELQIAKNHSFMFKDGPYDALVAAVKGNSIAELHNRKDVKARLFSANVRAALSAGKINKKIKETARSAEDGRNFFYYNNGITATCAEMTLSGNNLKLRGLQVVNGAQTVSSLAKALKGKNNNDSVYVMIRVIEVGDARSDSNRVPENITRYQNTQNPVKVSDFNSNEPLQAWIANAMDETSGRDGFPAIWYEYKRGVKPGSTTGRKKVTLEELGYLRYACLHGAPFTYKSAKDIWNGENGDINYWKAFGVASAAVTEWPQEEVARAGWMIRAWLELRQQASKIRDKYKVASETVTDKDEKAALAATYREAFFLSVMARYVVALAHDGIEYLISEGKVVSFAEIMKAPKTHQAQIELVLKEARNLVRNEYERMVGVGANPRLNLSQSDKTWITLKNSLRQSIVADEFD